MTANTIARYHSRFRLVLAHIDTHLDEALALEQLCHIAALSKYHFHRQFTLLFGISVGKYIQCKRLKRAAYLLAFREQRQVVDIALLSGFQGPEAFARAFKKHMGQSPSAFRNCPAWAPWHANQHALRTLRSYPMPTAHRIEQVRIVNFPATRVASLAHRGDPALLGDTIRQFIAWRKLNHLPPSRSATFNIAYDDPANTPAADFRMDLCAATDAEIGENAFGVVSACIPAGRCAVLRHRGADDDLKDSVTCLYRDWLPQSGENLRDFPLFFQRLRFFPDVAEHEAEIDIFLPLR